MNAKTPLINAVKTALLEALSQIPSASCNLEDGPVAVGVSGGADSMALVLLMADILGPENVVALNVDHGLRPEAALEVAQVRQWMAQYSIRHVGLCWQGDKPATGIQAAARLARYELMESWCVEHDVPYLLLAHHQGDQAETLLLRLARGSGVTGLGGMRLARPAYQVKGPWVLRPLLGINPDDLRAYLHQRAQLWIEDPSNEKVEFDRVRIRHLLRAPPLEGLNAGRLATTARHLARAHDALDYYMRQAMMRFVRITPLGEAYIQRSIIKEVPEEIVLRLLSRLCQGSAARLYPPRFDQVEDLYRAFKAGRTLGRTMAGCQIQEAGKTHILILRENAHVTDVRTLNSGNHHFIWDGRFVVDINLPNSGYHVAKVGETGWLQMRHGGHKPRAKKLSALSQPGLWRHDQLIAAPTLGFYERCGEFVEGFERNMEMKAQFTVFDPYFDAACLDLVKST